MGLDLREFSVPVIVAGGGFVVLLAIRWLLLFVLHRWAERRTKALREIYSGSLRRGTYFWCVALALIAGARVSDLPERYSIEIERVVLVLLIISVSIAAANLLARLLRYYIEKSALPLPTTGLTYGFIKFLVYVVGFLAVLNSLGVSIAPLLTALGVSGLAVALALQDTLSNFFAGIQILLDKPVKVGDFVRLETGQEGYVDDIGIRSTRILVSTNNIVVIPNNKLAQSVLTNYSLPDPSTSFNIQVRVAAGQDPEKVEKLMLDEAQKGMAYVPGLLNKPDPRVSFNPPPATAGENYLEFVLTCYAAHFNQQNFAQFELKKLILKRLSEEGIEVK